MSLGSVERVPLGKACSPLSALCLGWFAEGSLKCLGPMTHLCWHLITVLPRCAPQNRETSQATTGSRPVDPGRARNGGLPRHTCARTHVLDTNRVGLSWDFGGSFHMPLWDRFKFIALNSFREWFERVWNCIQSSPILFLFACVIV